MASVSALAAVPPVVDVSSVVPVVAVTFPRCHQHSLPVWLPNIGGPQITSANSKSANWHISKS